MKKNILKKIFSTVAAFAAATVVPLSAIGCGNDGPTWTPPKNTDVYNIPQDYARTYYEVFVRSFSDSNGDGIGDIRGLINNLDYLNDGDDSTMTDLGVNGIWLMPIHPSPSYHKYDVKDYYSIDPQYGTLDDFKDLVAECNKRGIWLQMDLVLNHTSTQHKWFVDAVADAKAGKDPARSSAMRKYSFIKSSSAPSTGKWHKVNGADGYMYLGNFSSDMPDLNLDNKEVRSEIEKIIRFWLENGVRSFRLDAVPWAYANSASYNEENGEFWTWFCDKCNTIGKEVYGNAEPELPVYCYNVGEVWGGGQPAINSFFGTGMSCFNYEMTGSYSRGFAGAINDKLDACRIPETLARNQESALAADPNALLSNFLSCHDNNRSGSNYFGFDVAKIKQAAALYLLSPGNAYIYYGEEIGAGGDKYGDNDPDSNIRMAFNWGDKSKGIAKNPPYTNYTGKQELGSWKKQTSDKNSVLTFYRETVKLRNRFPEIGRGTITAYGIDAGGKIRTQEELFAQLDAGEQYLNVISKLNKKVAIYTLSYNDNTILIAHNIGDDAVSLDISDAKFAGFKVLGELRARKGGATAENGTLALESGAVALLGIASA